MPITLGGIAHLRNGITRPALAPRAPIRVMPGRNVTRPCMGSNQETSTQTQDAVKTEEKPQEDSKLNSTLGLLDAMTNTPTTTQPTTTTTSTTIDLLSAMTQTDIPPKTQHSSFTTTTTATTSTATATHHTEEPQEDAKMKKTLGSLNMLLGVTDEEPLKAKDHAEGDKPNISISLEALAKLQAADAQRMNPNNTTSPTPSTPTSSNPQIDDQFQRIIEKAKQLANEQSNMPPETQQALSQEFNTLVEQIFKGQNTVSKEDVKKLKEAALGPMSFWVTEITQMMDIARPGFLIRGNLREERAKVYDTLCAKCTELFGDKYVVMMVEDVDPNEEPAVSQPGNGPRVAFQIVPKDVVQPPQASNFIYFIATIFGLLFLGSCGQLSLISAITKLPPETLSFFADPDLFDPSIYPPGLEDWDPTPYFQCVLPVFLATVGISTSHEVGHIVSAAVNNAKLGPPVFIPQPSIGTFGAITPIRSLIKNHTQLWDVAAAGPLAGFMASAAIFFIGLSQSHADGGMAQDLLVPIPTQLFQGSFLLGLASKVALGEQALRSQQVLIHPLTIAGWCGLVTTALNLLPAGSLDGGRMMQAAYGKNSLALTSLFTYLGLGLGLLGSNLALPFGLYVLICQRSAEKYIQDSVTPTGESRQVITAVAVFMAILILVPLAPEAADTLGVGPPRF